MIGACIERLIDVMLRNANCDENPSVHPHSTDGQDEPPGQRSTTVEREKDCGSQQIELFFDGERPRVAEGGARVACNGLVVVVDVEERSECLVPDDSLVGNGEHQKNAERVDVESRKDS